MADATILAGAGLMVILGVGGCGAHSYVPETGVAPAQLIVSAYTPQGCVEALQAEARRRGMEVELTAVEAVSGWELPFAKRFRCRGAIRAPDRPTP